MKIIVALFALLPATALAGTITATYTPPTQFEDNTTITGELTFVMYAGIEGQAMAEVARGASNTLVATVAAGRYCAQIYVVNQNIYSNPAPSPARCGLDVPGPQQTSRKPRPATNVTFTTGQ